MTSNVRQVLLVSRSDDSKALAIGREMAEFLSGQGIQAEACEHRLDNTPKTAESGRPPYDLILILGGDGTFLSVARRMHGLGVPFLALNLGRVGFLAELPATGWRDALAPVLRGEYKLRSFSLLAYEAMRGGKVLRSSVAVNDVVVSRGTLARLVSLGLCVDGEHVTKLRSDGIIVSTPTGSTAYCVSAGGPLLHPDLGALVLTPICPFLSSLRPMVVPDSSKVTITVDEPRNEVWLTEDGQEALALTQGDKIYLSRCGHDIKVVDLGLTTPYERLKSRGFITTR